jgi:NADH:ubiquinone oxidoreductase subunit 6 (subunit J)
MKKSDIWMVPMFLSVALAFGSATMPLSGEFKIMIFLGSVFVLTYSAYKFTKNTK